MKIPRNGGYQQNQRTAQKTGQKHISATSKEWDSNPRPPPTCAMKPLFAETCEESACVRASLVAALWFLMLRLIADLDEVVAIFVRGKNRDYKNLAVSFV